MPGPVDRARARPRPCRWRAIACVVGAVVALGIAPWCAPPRRACRRNSGSRASPSPAARSSASLDVAAHDELAAEDAHRLRHRLADHRLAAARHQPPQQRRRDRASSAASSRMMRPVSISAQVEALTNSDSLVPRCFSQSASAELVLDQLVGGLRVGDAQQRLGQAHQHHALAAGQLVLVQEGIDAALADPLLPHASAPGRGRAAAMRSSSLGRQLGGAEQLLHHSGFVGAVSIAQPLAEAISSSGLCGKDHGWHGRRDRRGMFRCHLYHSPARHPTIPRPAGGLCQGKPMDGGADVGLAGAQDGRGEPRLVRVNPGSAGSPGRARRSAGRDHRRSRPACRRDSCRCRTGCLARWSAPPSPGRSPDPRAALRGPVHCRRHRSRSSCDHSRGR